VARTTLYCPACENSVMPAMVQPPPPIYECDVCWERTPRAELKSFRDLTVLRGDAYPPVSPSINSVNLTADQTFTSSSVVNVTGLAFPLVGGLYVHFRFFLLVRNSVINEGAKFTLTFPTSTRFDCVAKACLGGDGAVTTWEDTILSSGDAVTTVNFPVANTDYPITIEGVIVPSAVGSVQLQAGNESSGGTVTVRQGSLCLITRLP